MSKFINGSTNWNDTYTISSAGNKTFTISTNQKYINKNIALTINTPSATPTFKGGNISSSQERLTVQNIDTDSSTNLSGISFTPDINVVRAAIQYDGNINGWVSKDNNTTALASTNSILFLTTQYVNGVTLTTPATGTHSFNITVPNGVNDTVTFHFSVDANGNTTITEGA